MLTKRQTETFEFIDAEITRTGGTSPSFDEIKDHLCLKSKSGVFRLMRALEDRGFIRRERCSRRAITILCRPGDIHADTDAEFATIPEDPADIEAQIEALHVLIAARLTALDKISYARAAEGADTESDFSKHGRLLRTNDFEYSIV